MDGSSYMNTRCRQQHSVSPVWQIWRGFLGALRAKAHPCRFGMIQETPEGVKFVKKPIGSLLDSPCIAQAQNKICQDNHGHVTFEGRGRTSQSRTSQAQVYPPELCKAICKGMSRQQRMDVTGMFTIGEINSWNEANVNKVVVESESLHEETKWNQAWDGATGGALRPELVRAARKEI